MTSTNSSDELIHQSNDEATTNQTKTDQRLILFPFTEHSAYRKLESVLLDYVVLPGKHRVEECFHPCTILSYLHLYPIQLYRTSQASYYFIYFRSQYWLGITANTTNQMNNRRLVLNWICRRKKYAARVRSEGSIAPLRTIEFPLFLSNSPHHGIDWSTTKASSSAKDYCFDSTSESSHSSQITTSDEIRTNDAQSVCVQHDTQRDQLVCSAHITCTCSLSSSNCEFCSSSWDRQTLLENDTFFLFSQIKSQQDRGQLTKRLHHTSLIRECTTVLILNSGQILGLTPLFLANFSKDGQPQLHDLFYSQINQMILEWDQVINESNHESDEPFST